MPKTGQRPDPDALLARVTTEERQRSRGRLKIFLGYAAGVGKTYAMLDAAHQRRDEGLDVVVGVVETHGRAETEARLAGLEVVPRHLTEYRGVTLGEMDLDAILARRPLLAVVDELAHTNAPGSRHPKRYHDVLELMDAGIDVYSTLNVQHLESLNDVVAQITGVVVRETVPDRVIDEAAEIELVDLPPDELLQRLGEGKVYVPEQARQAVDRFFRKGNLTALRELTLRRAAERVDDQMRAYMETRAIAGPWAAAERLLVLVGPSPLSERLVRTTRRLADELNAEWLALHVETSEDDRLSDTDRDQLARTMQLAEELGGHARKVPGRDVAETAIDFAQSHNVTKIVVGKPLHSAWRDRLLGSRLDRLVRMTGNLDVYVVSGTAAEPDVVPSVPRRTSPWPRYLQAVGLVAATTAVCMAVYPFLSPTNLVMFYLLSVVLAALYLGRGPAMLASALGVLAFDFAFVPPRFTFAVSDTEYLLTFAALFLVGLVVSTLTARVRERALAARRRADEAATLYALSRDLAAAGGLPDILPATLRHIREATGRSAAVLLPSPGAAETVDTAAASPGYVLEAHELAVARWAFQHGREAGRGTDTLPAAQGRYLPLTTVRGTIGVLGVARGDDDEPMDLDRRRMLDAFASVAALAIERTLLDDATQAARLVEATERLQRALLNSISHDLRTPLVAITGALTTLEEGGAGLDAAAQASLVETAREEADHLNRLVGNLLDLSRLQSGVLRLNRVPTDLEDLIGSALEALGQRLAERTIVVTVEPDVPSVQSDYVLLRQALVNVLENAAKYSPDGSPLVVTARRRDAEVWLSVIDRGPGIPADSLERVFEPFQRAVEPSADAPAGTGLGLAIARGVVEAHGGRVWAQTRPEGGTVVIIALPVPTDPGQR